MRKEDDAVAVDFIELMRDHNKGNSAFDMSKGINKVISAIRETGKKSGSVTLKLNFNTLDGDINKIYVTDEVSVKAPTENRRGSMFFSTEKGGLQRTDPSQVEMSFMREKKGEVE